MKITSESIKEALSGFASVREPMEDVVIIAPSYFLPDSHDGIAISIRHNDDGDIELSDCHTVYDYFDNLDIEPDFGTMSVKEIMYSFGIEVNATTLTKLIDGECSAYGLNRAIADFVQALTYITYAISKKLE